MLEPQVRDGEVRTNFSMFDGHVIQKKLGGSLGRTCSKQKKSIFFCLMLATNINLDVSFRLVAQVLKIE